MVKTPSTKIRDHKTAAPEGMASAEMAEFLDRLALDKLFGRSKLMANVHASSK